MLNKYTKELEKLHEELEKAVCYVTDMQNLGTENLKLYDVHYKINDIMEKVGFKNIEKMDDIKSEILSTFLDTEFSIFEDILNDKSCTTKLDGGTSSFYVVYKGSTFINSIICKEETDFNKIFSNIIPYYQDLYYYFNGLKPNEITTDILDDFFSCNDIYYNDNEDYTEDFNDIIEELEYFNSECKEKFENSIKYVYDYIREFKKEQTKILENFLNDYDVKEINSNMENIS